MPYEKLLKRKQQANWFNPLKINEQEFWITMEHWLLKKMILWNADISLCFTGNVSNLTCCLKILEGKLPLHDEKYISALFSV